MTISSSGGRSSSIRASSLNDATVSDPNLAVRRTDAAQLLESIMADDPDPARSSRAANFLGVLSVAAYNAAPTGATFRTGPSCS